MVHQQTRIDPNTNFFMDNHGTVRPTVKNELAYFRRFQQPLPTHNLYRPPQSFVSMQQLEAPPIPNSYRWQAGMQGIMSMPTQRSMEVQRPMQVQKSRPEQEEVETPSEHARLQPESSAREEMGSSFGRVKPSKVVKLRISKEGWDRMRRMRAQHAMIRQRIVSGNGVPRGISVDSNGTASIAFSSNNGALQNSSSKPSLIATGNNRRFQDARRNSQSSVEGVVQTNKAMHQKNTTTVRANDETSQVRGGIPQKNTISARTNNETSQVNGEIPRTNEIPPFKRHSLQISNDIPQNPFFNSNLTPQSNRFTTADTTPSTNRTISIGNPTPKMTTKLPTPTSPVAETATTNFPSTTTEPRPIPEEIRAAAQTIQAVEKNKYGLPTKARLYKMEGFVQSKGHMKAGNPLRKWFGDERLFDMKTWKWLAGVKEKKEGDGGDEDDSDADAEGEWEEG